MNPGDDRAATFDQLADLYLNTARTIDRFRETHEMDITDAEEQRLLTLARNLSDRGSEYNDNAARARLAAVQPALAQLGTVAANVKQQLKTVDKIQRIFAIAGALTELGEAIATGNLGAVGSALGDVGKSLTPLAEKAGASGGAGTDSDS